jgi:hypothetical protein
MPRMNILNTVEREAFESPPVFDSFQRKQYFDFPTELSRLAGELRAPTHLLGFLLSAGYFKAAKSFFPPSAFHRRDLEYVARQLELEDPRFDFSDYNPRTRQLHEITIRTFYGFRVFDPEARRLLLKEIAGGRFLVEHVIEHERDQDYLVYPIIFLYRHHIELALKNIIRRSPYVIDRALTHSERKHLNTHRLDILWQDLKPMFAAVCKEAGWGKLDSADEEGSLIAAGGDLSRYYFRG